MMSWNSAQPCPSEKQTAETTKGVYNRKENDAYNNPNVILTSYMVFEEGEGKRY